MMRRLALAGALSIATLVLSSPRDIFVRQTNSQTEFPRQIVPPNPVKWIELSQPALALQCQSEMELLKGVGRPPTRVSSENALDLRQYPHDCADPPHAPFQTGNISKASALAGAFIFYSVDESRIVYILG